ncbi:hypothetical protein INT47_005952 [Mucor saturninus]|uniref:PWWP domain-containing protein n=1 Tax=Mucor saturninus TaxID=64648 RepID=A0A8H7R6Z5_9FUNG|nr:hypothetical protein INT47_005952 [Mucor saturninus]
MRQQGRTEYLPGTTVFAKLKGYPWWPARIEADGTVPAKVLKQKSRTKGALYTVFFFGSRDYGFFGPDAIRPFDAKDVENDLREKKFKTKDLELAVRQALNPSLLTQEEEEEEREEEEEEVKEVRKKVVKTTKKATQKKKDTSLPPPPTLTTTTTTKRRSRNLHLEDMDDTGALDNQKKRRKSMSIEKEDEGRDSPMVESSSHKEEYKKSPEYKKGEIPKEDYAKILQVVKEIEEAPMTYNLLKDTKIGKVVKAACLYPFEDDTTIKDRCHQLMRNWKQIFITPQTDNKDTMMES